MTLVGKAGFGGNVGQGIRAIAQMPRGGAQPVLHEIFVRREPDRLAKQSIDGGWGACGQAGQLAQADEPREVLIKISTDRPDVFRHRHGGCGGRRGFVERFGQAAQFFPEACRIGSAAQAGDELPRRQERRASRLKTARARRNAAYGRCPEIGMDAGNPVVVEALGEAAMQEHGRQDEAFARPDVQFLPFSGNPPPSLPHDANQDGTVGMSAKLGAYADSTDQQNPRKHLAFPYFSLAAALHRLFRFPEVGVPDPDAGKSTDL